MLSVAKKRHMKSVHKRYFVVTALVWAGCLTVLFVVYMLVLAPQERSRKQIEKEFVEAKNAYDQTVAAAKDKTKGRLTKEIEDLQGRLKKFVIDYEDSANLTFDISQIASQIGVSSFGIKGRDNSGAQATADGDQIVQKRIQVSFTAGFNQFASFLNALERNRPVLFVDEFTITRSDQAGAGHQVDMDLAVFVRKRQDS